MRLFNIYYLCGQVPEPDRNRMSVGFGDPTPQNFGYLSNTIFRASSMLAPVSR